MAGVSANRKKRKDIDGTSGWQINEDGKFFHHRHERAPQGVYQIIDLGASHPRALPAYGGQAIGFDYFADELVCWTYHGRIELPEDIARYGYISERELQRFLRVTHLDGDTTNHAPDNLVREFDPHLLENVVRALARPDCLRRRVMPSHDEGRWSTYMEVDSTPWVVGGNRFCEEGNNREDRSQPQPRAG